MENSKICSRQKKKTTTYIPFDVLFNILSRFSFKLLSRFKSVCKNWNSWIEERIIPSLHHRFHNFITVTRQYLNRYNGDTEFYYIDSTEFYYHGTATNYFGQFTKTHPVQKLVSCNGLLCFGSNDGILRLCNPTRKEIEILPKPGFFKNITPDGGATKTPKFNTVCIGFGFDSTVQRYKILIWDTVGKFEPEILVLGTKSSWRTIKTSRKSQPLSNLRRSYITCSPIYIDGAMHWYGKSEIVSFDFSKEEFRVTTIPRVLSHVKGFHEIGGCLCLVETCDSLLTMWVLKDYDKGLWVKEEIRLEFNIMNCVNRVMAIRNTEILIETGRKELVIYRCDDQNQVTARITLRGLASTPNYHDYECRCQFHRESLVSVKILAEGCCE